VSAGGTLAVRLPNWLGDAVLALRAVDALAAHAGPGRLALIARPWAQPMFGERWPGARWLPAPRGGGGWPAHVPALARLRAEGHRALPALAIRPPARVLRRRPRAASGSPGKPLDFLLTHRAPRAVRGERQPRGRVPGPREPHGRSPVARIPLAADESLRARVREEVEGDLLVLAPGARYGPAKRWPPERFAEVATAWNGTVVLAGGAEDAADTAAVRAACAPDAHVLDRAGRTTLPELLALVAEARAVVSNDSGVAHLAGAAGRTTVAIFGSTDPRWTAPRGPSVHVVSRPPACSPCFRKTCRIPERYLCLRAIAPSDVLEALA
jgi:heptosyltransferase-2